MSETEETQTTQESLSKLTVSSDPPSKPPPSFSIWPPSDRTRDAVRTRLIETLSSPSVLTKRYGTVPRDEATDAAKFIEDQAFAFASAGNSNIDDGIEILQVYSKEISKRMLETVKSRDSDNGNESAAKVNESVKASAVAVEEEDEDAGSNAPAVSERTESVVADEE